MQNYVQPGEVLDLTAPTGGVTSGLGYKIGQLFVVAARDAAQGERFQGQRVGVFDLPKATGQAWTEGALLYWDDTAKKVTTTGTSNLLIGAAGRAEGSSAAVGRVVLNGWARGDEAGA